MMESTLPLRLSMADQQQQQQQQQLLQFYQPSINNNSNNKADSGLTYNININNNNNTATTATTTTRKRLREDSIINDFDAYNNNNTVSQKYGLSSIDGDASSFFFHHHHHLQQQQQQQQSDLNRLIVEHTEKMKVELEERRKRQFRVLLAAVQEEVAKRIKEKDEEIQRMGKLNWVLQERVKSLYVENQIWRDLAQTNEATANSLRSNLEQVLAHVSTTDDNNNNNNHHRHVSGGDTVDDAESSCGSCDFGQEREKGGGGGGKEGFGSGWQLRRDVVVSGGGGGGGGGGSGGGAAGRWCKKCGERESSVLLLPCRHLCLCTMCGSTLLGTCPLCDSVMNASVHVNMS